ncbi:forespore capture DNA-binding protein RefZ [Bacillus chungangensis]|uniref:AcrR family transcriptional regulator n=1 Tax=Bacillus chungangensis TaxID=587633 RepID=A0ABT9WU73_9BACI|nr:forespore capture DNA-binding protein RefZ [Bacillus chungangensis]MDQ0176833.1 AcrR family transcriptional regulator [Bacillus chungangensis]
MITSKKPTKALIMETAIRLFHTQGYNGTSVRDIAKKANINLANISYYFNGKHGLLEACLITFFEGYVKCLEEEISIDGEQNPSQCLLRSLNKMLSYQSENHYLSRVVWREVSMDTQIVREIIASYLRKERYLLKKVIEAGIKMGEFRPYPIPYVIIQLKSMLTMPFLNSQHLCEIWNIFPREHYFVEKYYTMLENWVECTLMIEPIH